MPGRVDIIRNTRKKGKKDIITTGFTLRKLHLPGSENIVLFRNTHSLYSVQTSWPSQWQITVRYHYYFYILLLLFVIICIYCALFSLFMLEHTIMNLKREATVG